jgi:hypothetical protein
MSAAGGDASVVTDVGEFEVQMPRDLSGTSIR